MAFRRQESEKIARRFEVLKLKVSLDDKRRPNGMRNDAQFMPKKSSVIRIGVDDIGRAAILLLQSQYRKLDKIYVHAKVFK